MSKENLFSEYELRNELDSKLKELNDELETYDSNKLLNTSTADLVEYFTKKYRLDVVKIFEEDIYVTEEETKIDARYVKGRFVHNSSHPVYINGTLIKLHIPFVGFAKALSCRPSTFTFNSSRGKVFNNEIIIEIETTDHDAEKVKKQLEQSIKGIKQNIIWLNNDIIPWNTSLTQIAKKKIEQRKDKLLKDLELVSSLGYKIKKRSSDVTTYISPEVRRKLPLKPPNASTEPFTPEPTLDFKEYLHILDVIKSSASMLERSPEAFKGMNEEDIRTHLLVALNSHYEGQASGETFNFNGKTDILIRDKNKAIFIAECKVWRGTKSFLDSINQLLGYATWRDTKVALIIFNRNKNLTDVICKIEESVKTHSNYKRDLKKVSETEFSCIIAHRDDVNRELVLSILVFEVPN